MAQVYRANPGYTLVPLDRLPAADRAALPGTALDDSECYGLLVPGRDSPLPTRPISPDLALLYLSLIEPGPLPGYARSRFGPQLGWIATQLVLDGVLEIARDGGFTSGALAAGRPDADPDDGGTGRIGELSRAALRYAQCLADLPEPLLAGRLYSYGRTPVHPRLRERLPNRSAIADHLGLAPDGQLVRELSDARWTAPAPPAEHHHWWHWHAPPPADPFAPQHTSGYKLYVSPTLAVMPDAVRAVAQVVPGLPGVSGFKVGADHVGLCRPDRLVVYLDQPTDLTACAEALRDKLSGLPADGVTFSTALTGDGLLSWGTDPPGAKTSWRGWVTARLARYLAAAQLADPGAAPPWRLALHRLRLSGVDTRTWTADRGLWATSPGGR
ncbi:hypothetical protein ABZU25_07170 [Micromonospora sp. NPDC005215]|uniref:hypothetical protein n=1 Tax=Micromonospora sp. NPDC005215 TaxID=3157024 RepID=UPI0033A99367